MLDKAYDPKPVEAKWGEAWRRARLFSSKPKPGVRVFSIVIPPPNVTGALHLGHALNNTLQDVLVRWNRMRGAEVCWVPGTDHGGIATQNVMEKQLKAEKSSRGDLGRGKFLERMQAWTKDCKRTISGQLDKLGCALDWEREAFTMDEARARSVFAAFKALWEKGLIYRGERLVNWCVRCGTALSDIEVEHEERKGQLWHVHYPAAEGEMGLDVATTRPETMLGDAAVAVHPSDRRYSHLVGKKLKLPLTGREIPVVADEAVESEFGTGAVKVTPAHDPDDFEIGARHGLALLKVIGPDGRITEAGGPYAGLSREQARDKVVADLKASGLLREVKDHRHCVGVCYRCSSVVEPLLSDQWFVKMSELSRPALQALDQGKFRIHPQSWEKPYRDWLLSIRDWCVSRQIWWGHRIPVWYCSACHDEKVVSMDAPSSCPACGGESFVQDPDVLDTWFSSALWPMSVFEWPKKSEELNYYYPTAVLVTGYEILYLWVARMQMMGLEFMGKPPFRDALIHGIVRDKSGKKMSKSLGNVIDPLDMMAKYGTDALRFSLAAQAHPGRDIPFSEDSLTGPRNFANKLWNSTRFVLMNLPEAPPAGGYPLSKLSLGRIELSDRWILAEHQKTAALVRDHLERYEAAAAADILYGFLWDTFCDWYVELAKIRLQGMDGEEKEAARTILVQVLSGTLKLLHPFMPFITEELYSALRPYSGEKAEFILQAGIPEPEFDCLSPEAEKEMGLLMEIIAAVRSVRAQLNVPPGLKIRVLCSGGEDAVRDLVAKGDGYIKALARVESLEPAQEGKRPAQSATAVAAGMSLFIPLSGLIDFDKEKSRLQKELQKAEADLKKIAQKMENKDFLARAPESEVCLARSQREAALSRQARLKETLAALE
ncbi:MAG: valine--tRNA ligase [Elusimicrobia bacterium]|nr:valine--tRNA ligase [Elusimicrobiota bacterium]